MLSKNLLSQKIDENLYKKPVVYPKKVFFSGV